jgi:exopolyphosphatase/pppGpp-phosphohydrolase
MELVPQSTAAGSSLPRRWSARGSRWRTTPRRALSWRWSGRGSWPPPRPATQGTARSSPRWCTTCSVTTVAALALELPSYQAERIHLSRISHDQVRDVTHRLLGMTRAQRAALPVMHPGRVDVIGGGALVLLAAVERFGLDEVLVSESDILDGIALSLSGRPVA